MIFLTAVLFCAVRFGLRSAVLASVLSFFAYDFFFVKPLYEFTIAEPQEFFALLIFLVVAVLTGLLAGRARDQAQSVRDNARTTQSIYELSRKLSGAAALVSPGLSWSIGGQAAESLKSPSSGSIITTQRAPSVLCM
jgi:two-component system sensor histidine kinase KdpD